jgi:sugar lactone lactonase YvrE
VRVVWTIRNGDVAAVPEALQLLPGAGEPVAVSSRPKYVAWYLAVDAEAGMAYWTSVGSVTRARLDGSGAPLTWDAGLAPVGIAWDPRERRVYWADGVAKVIKSSRADGTDVQVILHTATRPGGLALDADARLIFWTEDESGSVYSASIADPQPKRVVNGRTSVGPAIAVDPAAGRAYWGEMEAIASAGYSGESPASFPVVTEPAGLAVDVDNRRLYWTDAVDGSVHSSTLTGKGVTAVAQGGKARPMGIAVVREKDILGGD